MRLFQILTFLLLTCGCLQVEVLAQTFPGGGGGFGGAGGGGFGSGFGSGSSSGSSGELVIDTSDIFYFFPENITRIYPFSDSTLTQFQQYDPVRQQDFDWIHLGNLGSAHQQIIYQPQFRRGLNIGLNQFDLYEIRTPQVRFHKVDQAYTQADYSQGPTQRDNYFKVRFSRNFAKGVNLSIDHKRINNVGAYDQQAAENSTVAFGLWFHPKSQRYDGFLNFNISSIQQQDNGGTIEPSNNEILPPFQLDVNLRNAETRHAHREFAYTHYLYLNRLKKPRPIPALDSLTAALQDSVLRPKLKVADSLRLPTQDSVALTNADSLLILPDSLKGGKPDTLRPPNLKSPVRPRRPSARPSPILPDSLASRPKQQLAFEALPSGQRTYTMYHQIRYRGSTYKFSDDLPVSDTAYFDEMLVDPRGIRHYLEARLVENTFKLQTFRLGEKDSTNSRLQRDLVEVGLTHTLHLINQEPVDTAALHDLFLHGRINFALSDRLMIQTYGHIGLLNNAGDFRLGGELFLNLKKAGNFKAEVVNQLYAPSWLQHRFFISQQEFWKKDFNKTLETSISGTYSLPAFQFAATGSYHLIANQIYFDTAGIPQQEGAASSIFQVTARKDFKLKAFTFENRVTFQQVTGDVIRLPQLFSKHSLYVEGQIFKGVMLARIGLDARLISSYRANTYQPLTGQFHLQDAQTLPFTPLVDAFVSFKVRTFRFYLKVENLLTDFTKEYYYQTTNYAMPFGWSNGGIRFGISWRLVD